MKMKNLLLENISFNPKKPDPKYLISVDEKYIKQFVGDFGEIYKTTFDKHVKDMIKAGEGENEEEIIQNLIDGDLYSQAPKDKNKTKEILKKAKHVILMNVDLNKFGNKLTNYSNGRMFISSDNRNWYLVQSYPV